MLTNLALITDSLTRLIETVVKASPEWSSFSPVLTVSPQPPDRLKGSAESNILGFYLWRISDDAAYKNLPLPENATRSQTSSRLVLHYQLTAHAEESDQGVLQEQLVMGLAMQALRHYSLIDGTTEVEGINNQMVRILHPALPAGSRLRITHVPMPYDRAPGYWEPPPGPVRLAAYYQVTEAV